MLVNMVAPTGLSSAARRYFNLDWITLVVMIIVFIVGAVAVPALAGAARRSTRTCATTRRSPPRSSSQRNSPNGLQAFRISGPERGSA